jgi:hypothetical protein
LVLHQGGHDRSATRVDDVAAKAIAETLVVTNKRIKDQIPAPGSEAALCQLINDLAVGNPKYDSMTAEMAALTRDQLGQLQPIMNNLGAVQSVKFEKVMPDGIDVYKVTFTKGNAEFGIGLQGSGIISGVGIISIERK